MDNNPHQFAIELAALLSPIEKANGQRIKLIIHAGTPKTGTTSLQTYLNKKQGTLRRKGILYPHNLDKIKNPYAPKHQWFEKNLVTTHWKHLLDNFRNIISQVGKDTHTIILSSEGIYNYWWDFPDESKRVLSELADLFEIEVWVWFREPLPFIESYYKQCIRNPQIKSNPCYGKDLSFAQILDIDWFSRQLNYQGFVDECTALFGQSSVKAFEYKGDVVQAVIQKLGMATPHDNPTPRQNNSLHSATINMLRVVNRQGVKTKDKELLIPHLQKMNEVFERYDHVSLIDEASKQKVLKLFRPVVFEPHH